MGLFGPALLTKAGEKPTYDLLAGKEHILVYFSAHWCPPCRSYTPTLSAAYYQSPKAGTDTAIIFVSSDHSEVEFVEYYRSMTFYALPFREYAAKKQLSDAYSVSGIPALVVLDGAGRFIEQNVVGRHGEFL